MRTLFGDDDDSRPCPVCGRDLVRPEPGRIVQCGGCGRGITTHPRTGKLKTAMDLIFPLPGMPAARRR